MSLTAVRAELANLGSAEKSRISARFFKTGPGQYGEGDVFLGVPVPETRKVAIKHKTLPLKEAEALLKSKIHEERLCAVLLLVHNYEKAEKEGDVKRKKEILDFYLKSTKYINNWDIVDLSADKILGRYLLNEDRSVLYKLAASGNIWERRMAIIATFYFLRNNQYDDTIKLAKILLKDKHDLIQKAVGWMLRELGKKDERLLEQFLRKHYKKIPRTTLRYAIEKFPESKRKAYLNGKQLFQKVVSKGSKR
ncbi:MAG: DNA alkylation repair protein [Candidatus Aenigmarchaeota archaeon]|nr:DNA alkylation repair protein [Candidatus Aenigmarchaeota archaeon]